MAKKSFKSAISEKTSLGDRTGIAGVFSSTKDIIIPSEVDTPKIESPKFLSPTEPQEEIPEELRQSFIVLAEDFEKLKNFVYYKKLTVDPTYSQKEALHDAFHLLFSTEENIPERPEKVKKQERLRNANIRKKRASK